jgi:DNA polymerase/3'-5' exonuclease PolX
MSTGDKRPLEQAKRDANDFIALFGRDCAERWEIAGSIRRNKMMVGDVEHVVIPKFAEIESVPDGEMFPQTVRANMLFTRMDKLVEAGTLQKALYGEAQTARWGERLRGVLFRGFKHEIFIADRRNWGCILAIRTGPSQFSQRMVTAMRRRGTFVQGGLNGEHRGYVCLQSSNTPVSCETEQEFFQMCGVRYLEPHQRIEQP